MSFSLRITKPADAAFGEKTQAFGKDEITIGRAASNDLVLAEPEVSGKHAKIFLRAGKKVAETKFVVVDIGSSNGTFVETTQLPKNAETELKTGERIIIGNFILIPFVDGGVATGAFEAKDAKKVTPPKAATNGKVEKAETKKSTASYDEEIRIKRQIHAQLIERLDLRRKDIIALTDSDLRNRAGRVVEEIVVDLRWALPQGLERSRLIKEVLDEALGLGPLEGLLEDDDCSEIMVNRFDQIYAERGGRLQLTEYRFSSEEAVLAAIERILAPIGRRIDESSPLVDARLKDGSRVNAVIRPLALNGPCITIRKFAKDPLTIKDLVRFGSVSQGMADFLKLAVESRMNIVISGGTGSGKTTLLNVVSSFIPDAQRVVTVEDAAELKLNQEHVISFETRPPNLEGKGAITIRDLVRNALRMRPDRIIVGECRGAEALDMLQAMNTGHDGSMTTGHANTPEDMIRRLETMVLTGGLDLPIRAIREQIASAINLVVQQKRFACGTRRVTGIAEIVGMDYDDGTVTLEDIFVFHQEGFGKDGKVRGYHQATGYIPKFFKSLQERGLPVDASVFSPDARSIGMGDKQLGDKR